MPTYYEQLEVGPDASHGEVQRAYRRLAIQHHPDTQPVGDPEAGDRARRTMAALNDAWEVLGDPVRRRAYDAEIGAPPRPETAPHDRWQWEPVHNQPEDFDDEDDVAPPRPRRPGDVMVMTPVLLILSAVGMFFFSMMTQSDGLRTASILLVPVSGFAFVAAPLFVMLRGRSRPDR